VVGEAEGEGEVRPWTAGEGVSLDVAAQCVVLSRRIRAAARGPQRQINVRQVLGV